MIIRKSNETIFNRYQAKYVMVGRICTGYGRTMSEAIKHCLKDMKLVASLSVK